MPAGKLTRFVSRPRARRSIARQVSRVLARKTETKHRTLASGAFDYIGVSGAGTLIDICSHILQGTADNQRVGNKITLKKLLVSKVMRIVQSQSAENCAVRFLVVQSRGGVLTAADMPNYYSPVDLDKMFVLKDLFFNLSSGGTDYASGLTGSLQQRRIQLKLNKLPKKVVQYDGSGGIPNYPVYIYIQAEHGSTAEQAGFETMYYKDY